MINKQKIISPSDSDELKGILAHACDLYTKAEFAPRAFFTKFLTPADAREIEMRFPKGEVAVLFFGGYEGAERTLACFGEVYDKSEYPISAVTVRQKGGRELSHRDYMGTVLSLGLKREMVGDIVVTNGGAHIFCLEEIAPFIAESLVKVGGAGVSAEITADIGQIQIERKYEKLSATVSSLRLDCVVSAASSKARSASAQLISRGLVCVNYKEAVSVSMSIKDGDVLSIRGAGKFLIKTDERLTRKGRIHIDILKYM